MSTTLALVTGVWALVHSPAGQGAAGTVAAGATGAAVAAQPPLPPSRAKAISIPAISLEAPLVGLGLDESGHLATPPVTNPRIAGWYEDGPAPGARGTAVVVGHRDTLTGPAVFLNLNALHQGDIIDVSRADHRTAVFTIDAVRTYDKGAFPDAEVYGKTGRPELRLLTCGGSFHRHSGYSANIVVFSHLTGVRPA